MTNSSFGLPSEEISRAGALTYRRSLEEQAVQILATGTLTDAFYASANELEDEAIAVLTALKDSNPNFLARVLVWARSVALIRSAPILGLAILSTAKDTRPFKAAFPYVIQIPDDLIKFVEVCMSGKVRKSFGGVAQRQVKLWLETMGEFHTLKYSGKKAGKLTLRDVVSLAHPGQVTPEAAERFAWLKKGFKGTTLTSNNQIAAFEVLKRTTDEAEVLDLIREGRLPAEVVIPALKKSTPAIWSEITRHLPYLGLIRRLRALEEHGVFKDQANIDYVVDRLTDQNAIFKSKVMPFQLFTAWKQYLGRPHHHQEIAGALQEGLELSFVNMPEIRGRIAIAPDVSASMHNRIGKSQRMNEIAALFAAAFYKKSQGEVYLLPFEGHVVDIEVDPSESLVAIAERISNESGSSTAVAAPIQRLLDTRTVVDLIIGITDNEDWANDESFYGSRLGVRQLPVRGSFLTLFREYKENVNPDAVAILITLAGYRDSLAPEGEPDVHFVYGWSDRIVSYVAHTINLAQGDKVKEIGLMGLSSPSALKPEDDEEH